MTSGGSKNHERDDQFLTRFEQSVFRGHYRDYYKTKQRNFFSTIKNFRSLWESFYALDNIWMREIDDIGKVRDPNQTLPILLFLNAHNKFRIAWELVFSCRIGEAWDTTRGAIESAAHADKILREPDKARIWLSRDDGPAEKEAFDNAFWHRKRANLFPSERGFDELYEYYAHYSDWGTHTNLASVAPRVKTAHTETEYNWQFQYFEIDAAKIAKSIYSVLVVSSEIEKVFFNAFGTRLQFDVQLARMRGDFQRRKKRLANEIIARFNVERPTVFPK